MTKNKWWNLDNLLLVRGINNTLANRDGGRPPLLDEEELVCSIISPLTQIAYSSEGFVLKPVTPIRVSYTDIGSYFKGDSDCKKSRLFKGEIWTPQQISLRELMFFTLCNGSYNEVHVNSKETQIKGIFSYYKTVDEFIEDMFLAKFSRTSNKPDFGLTESMYEATLVSDFYVYKKKNIENNKARWELSDKIGSELVKLGYDVFRDLKGIRKAIDDLMSHQMTLKKLFGKLDPSEVYGGRFLRQPITQAHKSKLRKLLN